MTIINSTRKKVRHSKINSKCSHRRTSKVSMNTSTNGENRESSRNTIKVEHKNLTMGKGESS